MKKKSKGLRIFVSLFGVFGIFLFSANSVFAQCGNYFKTNYSAVNKLAGQFSNGPDVRLDDWTGDGRSDLWNFRWIDGNYSVVIYPSQPTGYWNWDNPIIYSTTHNNLAGNLPLIIKDFDSDGRMDMYLKSQNGFRIYRNTGNGSLTASELFNDSDAPSANFLIDFVDINDDNLLDWLYSIHLGSNPDIGELRYQLQNSDGSFSNKTTVLISSPENGLFASDKQVGDFNGDGKIDIIYSSLINNTNHYALIKNIGGGNFEIGTPVASDLYVPGSYGGIEDFNNDGRPDVLNRNAIFYAQADGTFNHTEVSIPSDFFLPAELNGDNNLDIMELGDGYYATHINNGAGGFSRTVYQSNTIQSLLLKFEDFSGDGKADIYLDTSRPLAPIIKNVFGETLLTIVENICQPFGETKLANFDDDENADLVMWNPGSGNWSLKNAKWFFNIDPNTRVFQWGLGALGDVPALGDFDGDGKTDYSVYRNSTGIWYIFKSSDSSWLMFQFGLTGDIPVPNDYDGGGKTDVAVFRPADGNWYIWFSETQQFQILHFGASGDKPVPADYDGDDKTDVAVFRPSEGKWYYLRSSDWSFAVIKWGIETDKPVPADYDGDGRADPTIYRDGIWWILRSSDNSAIAVQWGTASDIPMPVYRNLISADLSFYRPSNNSWYSLDHSYAPGVPLGSNEDVPVYFGLPNN